MENTSNEFITEAKPEALSEETNSDNSTIIDDNSISTSTVYSSSKVYDLTTQLSAVDTQLNDDLIDIENRLAYNEAEITVLKSIFDEGGNINITNLATKEDLEDKADIDHIHEDYALKTDIPTNISSFINDISYIACGAIKRIEIVVALPEKEEEGVLYIVTE